MDEERRHRWGRLFLIIGDAISVHLLTANNMDKI